MQRLNINGTVLPNFTGLNREDGTIYGSHNRVVSVNPHNCRFVATYPGGIEIYGRSLFETGWDDLPQGLLKLRYELSTGHIIEIPKFKAYMPLIECSTGMDGSRIFHFINVHCMGSQEVVVYKIVLRQDNISPYKIGDIIMGRQPLPKEIHKSWKYTS